MSFLNETWHTIVSAFDFEWSANIDQTGIHMEVQSLTWFEVLCCLVAISCICKSVWIYGACLVSCFRPSPAHVTYDSELVDEVCDAFDIDLLPKPRTSDFVDLANLISQMGAASLDTNNVDSEEDDDYRESQEPSPDTSTSLDTSHDSSNSSDVVTDPHDHQDEDNEDMTDDISQSCTSNDVVGTNDTNTVDPIEPVVLPEPSSPVQPVLRRSRRLAQKRLQKQAVLLDVVDAFMQQRLDRRKLE